MCKSSASDQPRPIGFIPTPAKRKECKLCAWATKEAGHNKAVSHTELHASPMVNLCHHQPALLMPRTCCQHLMAGGTVRTSSFGECTPTPHPVSPATPSKC